MLLRSEKTLFRKIVVFFKRQRENWSRTHVSMINEWESNEDSKPWEIALGSKTNFWTLFRKWQFLRMANLTIFHVLKHFFNYNTVLMSCQVVYRVCSGTFIVVFAVQIKIIQHNFPQRYPMIVCVIWKTKRKYWASVVWRSPFLKVIVFVIVATAAQCNLGTVAVFLWRVLFVILWQKSSHFLGWLMRLSKLKMSNKKESFW